MRAGNLRHRLTIQKPTEVSDGMGGVTTTWSTLITIWGAIWPLRGQEYMSAMQTTSEVTHKIRIRQLPTNKRSDFSSKCRILFGSRYFEIESIINPDERDIYLELMCKEITPARDG